jgi:hypothetical protein
VADGPVASPEITAAELLEHVRTLSSDAFEGRGSGTSGEQRATDYVAERFRELGLEPLFQPVDMPGAFRAKPECRLSLEAPGETLDLALGREWLPLSASADGEVEAEVVFAGYGIRAPELKYDDYAGLDVKGKIVVVFRNAPLGAWWSDERARQRHAPLV